MTARKDSYYRVGSELRDELIEGINGLDWEEDAGRAGKIKAALQLATPHRRGYLVDTHGWDWEDFDFLKTLLVDVVEFDLKNSATSRGISFGGTSIGRQIRALREGL
jgi:hypothetical protein